MLNRMSSKMTEHAPTWYLQSSLAGVSAWVQNGQKQMPTGLHHKILVLFNDFVVETVSHYHCCFILDFHIRTYDLTYLYCFCRMLQSVLYILLNIATFIAQSAACSNLICCSYCSLVRLRESIQLILGNKTSIQTRTTQIPIPCIP